MLNTDIIGDNSVTGNWPDRLAFRYKPPGGSFTKTGYHNEFGELRARPGRAANVSLRAMTFTDTGGSTFDIFQVCTGDGSTAMYFRVSPTEAQFGLPVKGVTPTDPTHLTTQQFVTDYVAAHSGTGPAGPPGAPGPVGAVATWPIVASNVGWQNIQRGGITIITPGLNRHFAVPFRVPVATSLVKVMLDISVAAAAGGTYRLGLYSSDASGLFPTTLMSEITNGVTTAITTLFPNLVPAIALAPNVTYWITFVAQNNITGPLTLRSRADNNPLIVQTNAAPVLATAMSCQYKNNITGALPNPFGSVDGQTQGPEFALWFS